MNRFYFGRYIQQETPSLIHTINPLIKLIATALAAGAVFYFGKNIISFTLLTLLLIILVILSGRLFIPLLYSIKSFKILYIFIFTTLLFFGEQGNFSIYFTKDALINALLGVYQFVLLVGFSSILSLTSSPSEIAKSLYVFIKPLKIFKINVENIGLSMLIAIRFMPLLFEESSKIITAQKLRGVWITDVTFKEKLKFIFNLDSFIVPLFVRVFHYAEQLSITALYRQNIGAVLTLNKINMKDISFLFIFAAAIWGIYAGTIIL